jgi:hypothetical protein
LGKFVDLGRRQGGSFGFFHLLFMDNPALAAVGRHLHPPFNM